MTIMLSLGLVIYMVMPMRSVVDLKDRACIQNAEIVELYKVRKTSQILRKWTHVEPEHGTLPNWLDVWTINELKEMQRCDPCLLEMFNLKERFQQKPPKTEINQIHRHIITIWNQWELLVLKWGLLYREIENDRGETKRQLLAPREIKDFIFT